MISVSQGHFKTKMNEYFKQVETTGEELIVTNRNMPIAKITPIRKKKHVEDVFADIRGKIKYRQDILKPETGEWEDLTI
jgi:prevent-host-death family protein